MTQPAPAPRPTHTRDLVTAALIAALLSASAVLVIPLQPVPITLQVFFVLLAALLLEPLWAFGAVAVYVALGAAGVPVFAEGASGLGALMGPTGGYLIGFALGALAGSFTRTRLAKPGRRSLAPDVAAVLVAVAVIYAVGAAQLALVTGMGVGAAIVAGVVPFIAIDLAKGAVAIVVATAVRRATNR